MSFYKRYIFPSFREKGETAFSVYAEFFLNKNNVDLYIVCQRPFTQKCGSWGYSV